MKYCYTYKNWRIETDYYFGLKIENGELKRGNPTFFPLKTIRVKFHQLAKSNLRRFNESLLNLSYLIFIWFFLLSTHDLNLTYVISMFKILIYLTSNEKFRIFFLSFFLLFFRSFLRMKIRKF